MNVAFAVVLNGVGLAGVDASLSSRLSVQAWYKTLVDGCTASGYKCGVYSSASQW